jgi:hypothetical protein
VIDTAVGPIVTKPPAASAISTGANRQIRQVETKHTTLAVQREHGRAAGLDVEVDVMAW